MIAAVIFILSLNLDGQVPAPGSPAASSGGVKSMPATLIHSSEGYVLKIRNLEKQTKFCSLSARYEGRQILNDEKVLFAPARGRGVYLPALDAIALRDESLAKPERSYRSPRFEDLEIFAKCIRVPDTQILKSLPDPRSINCHDKVHRDACEPICPASDPTVRTCDTDQLSGR